MPVADNAPMLLEARGLTKRFPGVLANDNVNLEVRQGEIVGLLGENGAGKSTLVKMLFGIYDPDGGEILLRGEPTPVNGPADAIAHGMGMVHQHFQLVGPLTVAENITLGAERKRGIFLDNTGAEKEVRELSERFGLAVDPTAVVEDLPVGVQQRVEILKALYRGAEILILDEPTAVLTPQETDELLQVMRDLAASGVGIIFITHKLREILAVTDTVTVLRGGKWISTVETEGSTQASLAELMVGRSVVLRVDKPAADPGEVVLSVRGLRAKDDRGHAALNGIDLEVRVGEIVGIAGVEGNGQRELVEALTGLRRPDAGTITIAGLDVTKSDPRTISELGVAHVPEDREKDGLVGSYSVADNLVLTTYFKPPFARRMVRQFDAVAEHATDLVERYDVKTPSIETPAASLSGGNKQKLVVARELSEETKLVIASQPTRGVDVGSIEFIHSRLIEERDGGNGVLVVSAELDEIFGLSDRIAVIYEGRIVAVIPADEATREQVGLLMAGATNDDERVNA
ncbi:MAG: ABC transporter ATP-binding protein [Acidimicrobiales bacterium]